MSLGHCSRWAAMALVLCLAMTGCQGGSGHSGGSGAQAPGGARVPANGNGNGAQAPGGAQAPATGGAEAPGGGNPPGPGGGDGKEAPGTPITVPVLDSPNLGVPGESATPSDFRAEILRLVASECQARGMSAPCVTVSIRQGDDASKRTCDVASIDPASGQPVGSDNTIYVVTGTDPTPCDGSGTPGPDQGSPGTGDQGTPGPGDQGNSSSGGQGGTSSGGQGGTSSGDQSGTSSGGQGGASPGGSAGAGP